MSKKVYWVYEKKSSKPSACSSLKAVSDLTGLKYPRLSYQFSKKNRDEYVTDTWRICVVYLISSKRNK